MGDGTRLDDLAEALPEGAVAVDFYLHRWYEPARRDGGKLKRRGRWTSPHVSAWVVRRGLPLLRFDLGKANLIAEAVRDFHEEVLGERGLLRGVQVAVVVEGAKATAGNDRLRELLWEPLVEAIGDARQVFVSGDGFLGSVPIEVLRREDGRYLIEQHAFVYLGDLTRLPEAVSDVDEPEPRLLAVGDVDFWSRAELEDPATEPTYTDDRARVTRTWPSLAGTRGEVEAIAALHRRAGVDGEAQLLLEGEDATEERIKQDVSSFTHVHLATHGYFLPEGMPSAWRNLPERGGEDGRSRLREAEQLLIGVLPGLLSGLVFAGANIEATPGRDNGLLTAEEITYLDLSACETGLGRPESGEGMIGLRRAIRMAGARTVISSLWEVSDASTSDLMTLFYENLWLRDMPKFEALRQAQLTLLEHNRETHGHGLPSTWGAFVLDGAPE